MKDNQLNVKSQCSTVAGSDSMILGSINERHSSRKTILFLHLALVQTLLEYYVYFWCPCSRRMLINWKGFGEEPSN